MFIFRFSFIRSDVAQSKSNKYIYIYICVHKEVPSATTSGPSFPFGLLYALAERAEDIADLLDAAPKSPEGFINYSEFMDWLFPADEDETAQVRPCMSVPTRCR